MIWLSRKTLKLFVMLFLGSSLLSTVGFLYPTIFTAGHMQLSVTEQQSLFSRIWNLSFLLRQMSFLSLLPQVRPGNLSLLYYSTNFPEPDELTWYTVVFFRLAVCLSYLYDLTEDIYVPGVRNLQQTYSNILSNSYVMIFVNVPRTAELGVFSPASHPEQIRENYFLAYIGRLVLNNALFVGKIRTNSWLILH